MLPQNPSELEQLLFVLLDTGELDDLASREVSYKAILQLVAMSKDLHPPNPLEALAASMLMKKLQDL